jgi:tRNA(Ile)-lysidine synthase
MNNKGIFIRLLSFVLALIMAFGASASAFAVSKDKNVAMLDLDLLKFPLVLRKWRQGDSFVPFGMRKEKKLSDYFTANKYSIIDKENQWILCSEDKIVWLVGERIDDRFRISNKTKNILKIELEK